MRRTVRAIATLSATIALSVAAGSGIAGAQEMEHGRTRPFTRLEVQTNQVKTQDAAASAWSGYIRG